MLYTDDCDWLRVGDPYGLFTEFVYVPGAYCSESFVMYTDPIADKMPFPGTLKSDM